jgi:hypothetical protein
MAVRSIALCLVVIVAGFGFAASAVRGQDPPVASEPDLELFDHMLEIKGLVRDLARSSAKPETRDDALRGVAELQKHVVAAKSMSPPGVDAKPEAERVAFVLSFRKAMTELLREVAELELDIIEDRNDEAVARITTTLIEMRDKAHETFQIE